MTDIRVPTLGESVTEATIGKWFKQAGEAVAVDEPLVELETDKVTTEVPAPAAGVLSEIVAKDGETVAVGALLRQIHQSAAAATAKAAEPAKAAPLPPKPAAPAPAPSAPPKVAALDAPLAPSVRRLGTESGVSTAVMGLRNHYKDMFEKRHGVKLGFMGLFVRACVQGLKEIPAVNAEIDGTDLIYKNYYHIGVAVGTEKGLVVPVVRDCDRKSLAEVEQEIAGFGHRARDGALKIEELQGGTFTITNGGIYGS